MRIVNTHQAEAWNGYEGRHWADNQARYDAMVGGMNASLFAAAAIEATHRVLDVGCGAGQTTRIAARTASEGHAVGIDLSEPMLERARRTTEAEGIGNVTYEQGDAQAYPFPGGHFDVAISRGGIMFFADPVAAFGNIGGALKPGGRLVFGCGRDDGDDAFGPLWAAMARHVPLPDPAADDAPGPVNFTGREHITGVLTAAGFRDVAATPIEVEMIVGRDAADAAGFLFGWGPVRHWLRDADPGAVAEAKDAVTAALGDFADDGGVRLRNAGWMIHAVAGR
ncbi:MAG TPA: class I SAM-dependent methyltransferase [Streptosporangiaceae bacterium]|jgi:SAM-dependent methyltransferase